MPDPTFTLLAVTTGRPTLAPLLASLRRELDPTRDDVLLLHDGPATPETRALWDSAKLPGRFIELADGPHRDWGHTPRNRHLPDCTGDWIIHIDDDDVLAPGALACLRPIADSVSAPGQPPTLLIPRMVDALGDRVWTKPRFVEGQVGTGNLVHPSRISFGQFGQRYGGDFDFATSLVAANPGLELRFLPEATYLVRPHLSPVKPAFRDLAKLEGDLGREDFQGGWQRALAKRLPPGDWLDIGAGLGHSRDRITAAGHRVTLHDLAPGLPVDLACPLADIPDQSADIVSAFDVLEHVPEDTAFVAHLVRIARRAVVITTPNVWVSRCANPHHVREYSPPLLAHRLLEQPGVVRLDLFTGDPQGRRIAQTDWSHWNQTPSPQLAAIAHKP
jgi:hypothetical protein